MKDFDLRDEGSLVLLTPETDAGREWVAEHLPADCPMLGKGYAIEKRFIYDILDGAQADGMTFGVSQ